MSINSVSKYLIVEDLGYMEYVGSELPESDLIIDFTTDSIA